MRVVIDIPEEDIPKVQGTMEIHLCFCDGKLCQCDYPFDTDIEQMSSICTESPNKCDDAISRQAAIRLAEQGQVQGFEWQFKQLVDLPSVSTEKTGHWIYKTIRGEEVPCCSRCGLDNGTYYEFKFCPECGANMIEPQESEE